LPVKAEAIRASATVPEATFDPFKFVRLAPDPLKTVADKVPVDGTNESAVDEVFMPLFPVLVGDQAG
jgi:hypothetical protein